jgi:hypothetical protein
MHYVIQNMAEQVPLWVDALQGKADWSKVYAGQQSAVDWPTASFYRELHAVYPDAKFILTHRSPQSWVESFSETILTALSGRADAPEEVHAWMDMCLDAIARAGFSPGMSPGAMEAGFNAHNDAVREVIPAAQLLEFQVKEGWEPLCSFLQLPIPDEDFPRTNDREQFWQAVRGEDI